MVHLASFWKNLKFAVKQCYQTVHFQLVKNWWKMPKFKTWNATFWVIFKHYEPWLSNRMNKLLTSQIRSLTMYQSNEGTLCIVFENLPKSRIQHCERSELYLHFEWTKVHQKCQKWPIWRVFENLKLAVTQCYQTGQF